MLRNTDKDLWGDPKSQRTTVEENVFSVCFLLTVAILVIWYKTNHTEV